MSNSTTTTTTTTPALAVVRVPAIIAVPVTVNRAVVASLTVNVGHMAEDVREYLFNYGLRQCLNDAKAGESDPGAAQGLMEKRLERLMNGEFGTRGASAVESDPVRSEALKMAVKAVTGAIRKQLATKAIGGKLADYKEAIAENAAALIEADPAYMAQAAVIVKAKAAVSTGAEAVAGGFRLNLSSLGLAPAAPAPAAPEGSDESGSDDDNGDDTPPTGPALDSTGQPF